MAAAAKSTLTEYYTKGEVVAKDIDPKDDFKNLPSDTIIVRVKHGSKVRNILGFVEKSLKDEGTRCMIFSGCGDAIEKTITCVEIAKTKFKDLHQITKLNTLRVEEYWEPIKPDLDRLQVSREIPMVSILLSKDALDITELGYQGPGNPLKMKKSFKRKKTSMKEPSTSKDNSNSTETSQTE